MLYSEQDTSDYIRLQISSVCCKNAYDLGTIRQNCYKILCIYKKLPYVIRYVRGIIGKIQTLYIFILKSIIQYYKQVTFLQRLNVRTLSNKIRCASSIVKIEHKNNPSFFNQWLVGFTDGDGTFIIDRQENGKKWILVFKISQKSNNGQLLYYIKSMQGVGQVTESKDGNWSYRIRNKEYIKKIIFPIFDSFPLRTVKYFDYMQVKQAYDILTPLDTSLKIKEEINIQMEEIYKHIKNGPEVDYKSPVWKDIDCNNITSKHIPIISKPWLIGFWEAEGSFYIVKKEEGRYVHGIGLIQKTDRQIIEIIRQIFDSKAKVKDIKPKQDFYSWDSTSKVCCNKVKIYFTGYFIGRISYKFAIWGKSISYQGEDLIESINLLKKLT